MPANISQVRGPFWQLLGFLAEIRKRGRGDTPRGTGLDRIGNRRGVVTLPENSNSSSNIYFYQYLFLWQYSGNLWQTPGHCLANPGPSGEVRRQAHLVGLQWCLIGLESFPLSVIAPRLNRKNFCRGPISPPEKNDVYQRGLERARRGWGSGNYRSHRPPGLMFPLLVQVTG